MKKEKINNILNPSNSDNVQDIIFTEIDGISLIESIKNTVTSYIKSEYVFNLFLTEGHGEIVIDNEYYKLDSNEGCLLTILPQTIIGTASFSKDFKGYILGIHNKTIKDSIYMISQKVVFPILKMLQNPNTSYPLCKFSEVDRATIRVSLSRIKDAYDRTDFNFQDSLIKLEVARYLLEVMNIMIPEFIFEEKKRKVGFKETICNNFILMAMDNHRQHHMLEFYAEKLHISTQYLTHLVKTTHGMTANKVLNNMILLDAKAMLKLPAKSVKEIAFELNFADQSSFGKFFKKHTGISASKYRKTK